MNLRRRLTNIPSMVLVLAQIVWLVFAPPDMLPPFPLRWSWLAVACTAMLWFVYYWWIVNFRGHTPGHWKEESE